MTNEEMQKTMQFIVEQQALFAVDIQKLSESQAKFIEGQAKITEANLSNTQMIGRIINIIDRLAESQAGLAESQKRTDNKVAEMAERLDTFIVTVEKYIAEGGKNKDRH